MLPLPEGTLEGTIMSNLFTVQIKKLRPPQKGSDLPTATLLVIDWGTVRIEFRSSTDFEIPSSTFLYSSNYPFSLCYEAPKFVHFKSNYVRWQCLLCFYWFSSESGQPICGNGMVEQGEECDCGYSDQCKDECCYDANQPEGKKCKLKPGKQCRYPACPGSAHAATSQPRAVRTHLKLTLRDT